MGCWCKTCGVSNLFIEAGVPVYVFPLEKKQYSSEDSTTDLWKPVMLPFESQYNDYGGGENSDPFILNIILSGIKKQMVEQPLGENKYHDIEVRAENLNEELFFSAVHEGRLFINEPSQGAIPVDFVMVRKDIVDNILKDFMIVRYFQSRVEFSFNQIMDEFDNYYDKCIEIQFQIANELDNDNFLHVSVRQKYFPFPNESPIHKFISDSIGISKRMSKIVSIADEIIKRLTVNKEEAKTIFKSYFIGYWVHRFLYSIRKQWQPTGYEGYQHTDDNSYRILTRSITSVLDSRESEC